MIYLCPLWYEDGRGEIIKEAHVKKLIVVCLSTVAFLISTNMGLAKDAFGAPPEYGTIIGNTWTDQMDIPGSDSLTYSFAPVPDRIKIGHEAVYSLKPGNTMAWKDAGIQIYSITEFDDSEMGEHLLDMPPVYEAKENGSFTFNQPGLFMVYLPSFSSWYSLS